MKKTLFLMFLSFFSLVMQAQTVQLKGTVKDAVTNEELIGVNVIVVGTKTGTVTGINGDFEITVPQNATLKVSYVGYKSQEIKLSGASQTTLYVKLESDTRAIDEVVVVGYSSQKKSSLTGAVSSVNMTDLAQRKVPDVAQMLQGQVAGVQVTQSTGAPGDDISIVVRGVGSINSGTKPLYIIDGNPSESISFINPSDILSMTVLKDAAAAALYGARASGGVIVITSKSGKSGKVSFEASYNHGIQQVTNLPTMLNGTQYMNKMEESWNNANPGQSASNPYTPEKSRTDLANTNWLKELFTPGQTDNVQLSVSGGTEKVQYYLSGSYFHQNGIVVSNNDQFNRINFHSTINANLTDRFKVGSSLQIVNSMQDALSSSGDAPGIIRHAFIRPPVISVYKDSSDPTYSAADPFTDLPFYSSNLQRNGGKWNNSNNLYELSQNPVALAYNTNDKRGSFRTFGNVFGEYALLKDKSLKFKTNIGVDVNFIHNKAFNKNFGDDDGQGSAVYAGQGRQNRPNTLAESRAQESTITWTNTATYNKQINLHAISVLAGSEYVGYNNSGINGSRENYSNSDPAFQYLDFGNQNLHIWNGGAEVKSTLFSLFAGVNYNYDNRYYANVNLRRDESSQFAANNQTAYFPSFSAAWRISQESFMKDIKSVSDLKLRISSGKLGNQSGLSNYPSLAIYDSQGTLRRLGNPDLKWETTTQNDLGLDASFFNSKVSFTFDYYQKVTSDLLLPLNLPTFVGDLNPTIVNAGKMTNKGVEISAGYKNFDHDFKYSINANVAMGSNVVNELPATLPSIYGQVTKTEAGHPLNSYYGYQMAGIYQTQAEIDGYLDGAPHSDIKPGYIKFKDLNDDGIINDKDRTYLGNPNPRMTYGLNLTFSYKAFDFSMFVQGVQGVERWNDLKKILDYDTRPFNHTTSTLDSWHGAGTSNTIPISTFADNGSSNNSSIFVENASYLRLKNMEIGCSLQDLFKKYKNVLPNIRIYVSMQNVLTLTKYTGLDPESTSLMDKGTYPQARAFLFGFNTKF
jgi:TonB-dependent starch-binding outer membrane protein SusC